jgi:TonB family protein
MPRASGEAATAPSRDVAPSQASGAPETGGEPQTIVVQDGVGSFRIRKAPTGQGPGNRGGAQQPGRASSERNSRAGSQAQSGSNANLRLSWSQFEEAFGSEELRKEREAYLAQRRSTAEGHGRQRSWKEFRAAIENFVPNVRPGDQTALNAAADPFANYLALVHRRIHREFAFGFLEGLPIAGGPFGDYSLHTELEIVINGDGSVQQVGIAETSGFLPFDYGAFNAVMRAAPYPPPPRKILSGDGRVYVHWGFYRNERQCGTFNARPYILPHPPGTPKPGNGPLHDPGEQHRGPVHQSREGELGKNDAPALQRLADAER